MSSVQTCLLPSETLLARYAAGGAFADCYYAEVPRAVSQSEFVEAFYLGPLMQLERKLIGWLLSKSTSDTHVRELANGEVTAFAAWSVEERTSSELLLRDQTGRTRSWLMSRALPSATRLYFGSAVLPQVDASSGARRMGPLFRPLLGFHGLYSRLLLASASSRLERPST